MQEQEAVQSQFLGLGQVIQVAQVATAQAVVVQIPVVQVPVAQVPDHRAVVHWAVVHPYPVVQEVVRVTHPIRVVRRAAVLQVQDQIGITV